MKEYNCLTAVSALLLLVLVSFVATGCATYQGTGTDNTQYNSAYNLNDLNNYGEWLSLSPYGDVWRPYVVSDWMPFNNGYWAYDGGDWTWISYEPFGWIVYHYGYWYDDPSYGWVWVPSEDSWSPARVEWINYGDYIGWAPLPPPGINYGEPWEMSDNHYWNVVRKQNFIRDDIRDYRVSNPIRNEAGGRGVINLPPNRSEIESATGGTVQQVTIQREPVKLPPREIDRMNLPPAESRKVEQKSSEVKQRDLIPRTEFHRQHPEIKKAPERQIRKN
jgi:predicted small secreted protein